MLFLSQFLGLLLVVVVAFVVDVETLPLSVMSTWRTVLNSHHFDDMDDDVSHTVNERTVQVASHNRWCGRLKKMMTWVRSNVEVDDDDLVGGDDDEYLW